MSSNNLPPGWEMQFDQANNKYFFIDHVNKKTTWNDPRVKVIPVVDSKKAENRITYTKYVDPRLTKAKPSEQKSKEDISMKDLSKSPERRINTNETNSFISKDKSADSGEPKTLLSVDLICKRFPTANRIIVEDVVKLSASYDEASKSLTEMGFIEKTIKESLIVSSAERIEPNQKDESRKHASSTNIATNHFAANNDKCKTATPTPTKCSSQSINIVRVLSHPNIQITLQEESVSIPTNVDTYVDNQAGNFIPDKNIENSKSSPSYKTMYRSSAQGPDKSLTHGPDRSLINGPSKVLHQSHALGRNTSLHCGPNSGLVFGSIRNNRLLPA